MLLILWWFPSSLRCIGQHGLPRSVLLHSQTDVPYLSDRCFMLHEVSRLTIPECAVLVPGPRTRYPLSQAVLRFPSASHLLTKSWATGGVPRPRGPFSLSVSEATFAISVPSCCSVKQTFDKELVEGRAQDLATGIINKSLTYWVSARCQTLCINYLVFIHSKSCDVSTF